MTKLEEVVWAQEEPKNNGAWVLRRAAASSSGWREAGLKPKRPVYAGRDAAASPATGLAKRHAGRAGGLDRRSAGP